MLVFQDGTFFDSSIAAGMVFLVGNSPGVDLTRMPRSVPSQVLPAGCASALRMACRCSLIMHCYSCFCLQGNMGGGFTHFLMPLVFDGIKSAGSPAFQVCGHDMTFSPAFITITYSSRAGDHQ